MAPGSRGRDDDLCKIATITGKREGRATAYVARQNASRQLVIPFPEPVQAERKTDALFGGVEDDERRGLGGPELTHELVAHPGFGSAAIGQAADKPGAADVDIVELQAEAGGQEHAEWRHHAHQLALLICGLQHDDGEAGIGAVFGYHALDQGALLALRARRGVAANLPVAMDRSYRALRVGGAGRGEQAGDGEADGGQARAHAAATGSNPARGSPSRPVFRRPHPGRSLKCRRKATDTAMTAP